MKNVKAAVTAVLLVGATAVSSPASADKPGEPAESGVVLRFDPAIGGHLVGPVIADVNGEDRVLGAVFGWSDAQGWCSGEDEPVENGINQVVLSPSGNVSQVVHNRDIPVLVFDVTDVLDEAEFIAKCVDGTIAPLATGTAQQRPIVHQDDTGVTVKVKSQGVVTDTFDRDWKLQAFLKENVTFDPFGSEIQSAWIKLTLL